MEEDFNPVFDILNESEAFTPLQDAETSDNSGENFPSERGTTVPTDNEPLLNEDDINQDFEDTPLSGEANESFEEIPIGQGESFTNPDGTIEIVDTNENISEDPITGGNNSQPINLQQDTFNNNDFNSGDAFNNLSQGILGAEISSDIRNLTSRNPREIVRFNPASTINVGVANQFIEQAGELIENSSNEVQRVIEEALGIE